MFALKYSEVWKEILCKWLKEYHPASQANQMGWPGGIVMCFITYLKMPNLESGNGEAYLRTGHSTIYIILKGNVESPYDQYDSI